MNATEAVAMAKISDVGVGTWLVNAASERVGVVVKVLPAPYGDNLLQREVLVLTDGRYEYWRLDWCVVDASK